MATQTLEFSAASGLTISCKLFAIGSDTVVDTQTATEKTNDVNRYSVDFVDVAAGAYRLNGFVGSDGCFANEVFDLTLTTATFQPRSESAGLDAAGVRSAVGLASANLDTTFGDIKGSTFDSSTDSLEAIRDRGDSAWTTGGAGTGLYVVTITVEDSSGNALQGAKVTVSGTTLSSTSGSNGQVVFNLDAGSYTLVVAPPAGYATPANTALSISADSSTTITLSEGEGTDSEGWI